ncbi:MAG: R3H domain-containing nucleic acid-binding protein [bacterium]|nr:R3H domain-containing nucleic acid-binding protein [bacterium]
MNEENKQQIDLIETTIKDILGHLGISYDLEFQEGGDGSWFQIKTNDAPLLIGEAGQNLAALNHVVKKIVEKKVSAGSQFRYSLDINDYNKKRVEEIKDLARMHAQRVRYFKKEIEMRPMNAYERRVVHYVLQEYPDIATESRGDGLERRVVIKPLNLV